MAVLCVCAETPFPLLGSCLVVLSLSTPLPPTRGIKCAAPPCHCPHRAHILTTMRVSLQACPAQVWSIELSLRTLSSLNAASAGLVYTCTARNFQSLCWKLKGSSSCGFPRLAAVDLSLSESPPGQPASSGASSHCSCTLPQCMTVGALLKGTFVSKRSRSGK